MSRVHKICISAVSVLLAFAVILGIAAKNSYQYFDPENAILNLSEYVEYAEDIVEEIDANTILNEIENCDSVFVVTVKGSENVRQTTKTTAYVDRVIKGDESVCNTQIVIYEPNFMYYNDDSKMYSCYFVNMINNLMQIQKQYLVFANKIDYSESYQKTLDRYEYLINIDLYLYSFPLDSEIEYIKSPNSVNTFGDIKSFDYLCYCETDSNTLNEIRLAVLDAYL